MTIINAFYFTAVAAIKRRYQIKFIEKIQKIDDTLVDDFKTKINYSAYKTTSLVILAALLFYYNLIVSTVVYVFLLNIKSFSDVTFFIIYILQSATSGIFTYGFVGYVILINIRLRMINEKLQDIVRIPPEILEKQYKSKDALCMEMMRFTKLYKSLCSCVDDLNEIYGSSMVLHFAHDFTLLTSQIFAMFYVWFFDNSDSSIYKILAILVWLLPNILKMSFICLVCHVTRNEVRARDKYKFHHDTNFFWLFQVETCGLYLRKFSNEANEDEIADIVDMFSLQAIHLKTEFSANNFFSIDMSLFFTIISACTTYLVILIQFKHYEDENDESVLHGNMTTNQTVN